MEGTLPNDLGPMSEAARAARAARAEFRAEQEIEVAVALGELVKIIDPVSGEKWYAATPKWHARMSLGLGGLPEQRVPAAVHPGAEVPADAKEIAVRPAAPVRSVSTRAIHARKRSRTPRHLLAGALAVLAVPGAVISAASAGNVLHSRPDTGKTDPASSGQPSVHGPDSSPQPMEDSVSELDDSRKVKPSSRPTAPVQKKPEAQSTARPQSAPTGRRRKGDPEVRGEVYQHPGDRDYGGRHRGPAASEQQEVTLPGALREGTSTVTRFVGELVDNLGTLR